MDVLGFMSIVQKIDSTFDMCGELSGLKLT